jgi:hypothetical protein
MDVVVTVPKRLWREWLDEGCLPGDLWDGLDYYFWVGRTKPRIEPGDRVYIVANGRLRGYALLVRIHVNDGHVALVRRGGAEAVTIPGEVRGFQGYRYRWWERSEEVPFPDWRVAS